MFMDFTHMVIERDFLLWVYKPEGKNYTRIAKESLEENSLFDIVLSSCIISFLHSRQLNKIVFFLIFNSISFKRKFSNKIILQILHICKILIQI